MSNGFLTECCVPWDAIQFYAKTDPAYRVSPPLHNNFLVYRLKAKAAFQNGGCTIISTNLQWPDQPQQRM